MDAQILSVVAFVSAAIAAWIALKRQNGTPVGRIQELEKEVERLTVKAKAQELQISYLLAQLSEQSELIKSLLGENEAKDFNNERLRKRLIGGELMEWPLWEVMIVLAVVSVAFNELVALVNKRTRGNHPLAAVEVALGTAYTIAGAWLVDGDYLYIWTLFWCFVASGTPMIIGDVFRWLGRIRQ